MSTHSRPDSENEPSSKKAKSIDLGSAPAASDAADAADDGTSVLEVLKLRLIGDAKQVAARDGVAPEFAHQIWPDETLQLDEGASKVRIEILHNDVSLEYFLRALDAPMEGAVEEAMYKLADAMPSSCATLGDFNASLASTPPTPEELGGTKVDEYEAGGATFDVHLCEDLRATPLRVAFNERLQTVMRWFIETWGPIDLDDERWRLACIFEGDRGSERRRLVGAATVFHFQRWVGASDAAAAGCTTGPRLVVRLCQMIVLPAFRSGGHGGRLLRAVYEHARSAGALEVTVEDPNPRCRLLRDVTDLRECLRQGLLKPSSTSSPVTAEQTAAARRALLVTDEQVSRCYEIQQYMLLRKMQADNPNAPESAVEAVEKPWRLAVKRRLNKKHKEELDNLLVVEPPLPPQVQALKDKLEEQGGAAASTAAPPADPKEARKAKLEELYQQLLVEYDALAQRVAKPTSSA